MKFPYTAWVLMPSFKPVEITLVEAQRFPFSDQWHKAESGKTYAVGSIYSAKHAAIAAGHVELIKQQAALDKKQANINKRRAALEKASQ